MTPRKSPPNRRVYQKHGLYALKGAIKGANGQCDWLESLGDVGVALKAWKADLVADLGGDKAVSTQERAVVDMAVRTHLMLESVDRWLLQQPSLVNKSRRQLFPVVLQRQQLADALARYMAQLGLKRRLAPVKTLATHIEEKYGTSLPDGSSGSFPGTPRQATEEAGEADSPRSPPAAPEVLRAREGKKMAKSTVRMASARKSGELLRAKFKRKFGHVFDKLGYRGHPFYGYRCKGCKIHINQVGKNLCEQVK